MSINQLPKDGINPYSNHPGVVQGGCEDRHTISQTNPYGTLTRAGFGCLRTGGHCAAGRCPRGRFDDKGEQQEDTIDTNPQLKRAAVKHGLTATELKQLIKRTKS